METSGIPQPGPVGSLYGLKGINQQPGHRKRQQHSESSFEEALETDSTAEPEAPDQAESAALREIHALQRERSRSRKDHGDGLQHIDVLA